MAVHATNFRELRLDRLSRDFGTVNALRDVTLTVKRGEFICLLGPSGCGKSTALNCIAGLLPATAGSIWLDEKRIDNLRPEQRGFELRDGEQVALIGTSGSETRQPRSPDRTSRP